MATFKNAQAQEQSGKLAEAKELYATCAKTACGTFLAHACTGRFTQLDTETPTIVPVVTDQTGAPRADVEVKMDGTALASRLDGRALSVPPGMHEFTFLSNGQAFATEQIMIIQGQRNRTVAVTMGANGRPAPARRAEPVAAAPKPPVQSKPAPVAVATVETPEPTPAQAPEPAPEPATTSSGSGGRSILLPAIVGGVGLLGLAGYGTLVAWGRKDNDALSQCNPDCPQASVDHIRKLYIGADISLGVGIAALGTATYLFLTSKPNKENATAKAAYTFNVQPTKAGGFASVAGAF